MPYTHERSLLNFTCLEEILVQSVAHKGNGLQDCNGIYAHVPGNR
jgi:hypothetical protein